MNLDAPVIALVGPNEAGKSTLLEAIVAVGRSGEFNPWDITRNLQPQGRVLRKRPRVLAYRLSAPLRGPRKVLRRVPSALRCPHPETSQKRPTQRMRGLFSRLTDSWVPVAPLTCRFHHWSKAKTQPASLSAERRPRVSLPVTLGEGVIC